MNITQYQETEIEQWINEHYQAASIVHPSDMDIYRIAEIFKAEIREYIGPNFADWDDAEGYAFIFLDLRSTPNERRANFFHELTHPIRHCGRQEELGKLFVRLQEIQADQFQLYAALPSYMIARYHGYHTRGEYLQTIAEDFRLPLALVQRRIAQMEGRISAERSHRQFLARISPVRVSYGYSTETMDVVQRAEALKRRKGGCV